MWIKRRVVDCVAPAATGILKNTHVRKAKRRRALPEIVCRLQAHRHSLRPVSQTIGNITAHRSIRFWNILVIPEHDHSNANLSTYLKASLGRSCQLLDPVLTEPPRLSQLLLQLLLPTDQCWIGAARKEPVILNQFCATGKGECCLDWGWIYGWEVGYIYNGQDRMVAEWKKTFFEDRMTENR